MEQLTARKSEVTQVKSRIQKAERKVGEQKGLGKGKERVPGLEGGKNG